MTVACRGSHGNNVFLDVIDTFLDFGIRLFGLPVLDCLDSDGKLVGLLACLIAWQIHQIHRQPT